MGSVHILCFNPRLLSVLKDNAPVELNLVAECSLTADSFDNDAVLVNIVLRAEDVGNILNPLLAEVLVAFLSTGVLVSISGDEELGLRILLDDILHIEVKLIEVS